MSTKSLQTRSCEYLIANTGIPGCASFLGNAGTVSAQFMRVLGIADIGFGVAMNSERAGSAVAAANRRNFARHNVSKSLDNPSTTNPARLSYSPIRTRQISTRCTILTAQIRTGESRALVNVDCTHGTLWINGVYVLT